MKVAIIGGGTMGSVYANNIAKMKDVQPAGVCDIRSEKAEKSAKACSTNAYTDMGQLLAKEDPDVVCLCIPTYLHRNYFEQLAAAGKHIICEKPIALSLEDARSMIDSCRKHQVHGFIGQVLRFFPNYADAAEKVKYGKIGKPGIAHMKRISAFPSGEGSWFRDREKSGGVIVDLMIHDIDYARSIFGEVQSVYARLHHSRQPGAEMEYAQVTLKFRNKAIANLEGFWGYPGPFTTAYDIAGDQGIIRFDSSQSHSLDIKTGQTGLTVSRQVQVPQSPMKHDPYYYEISHFLDCIREEKAPIVSMNDACHALSIALAAEQSARTGMPVEMEGEL